MSQFDERSCGRRYCFTTKPKSGIEKKKREKKRVCERGRERDLRGRKRKKVCVCVCFIERVGEIVFEYESMLERGDFVVGAKLVIFR